MWCGMFKTTLHECTDNGNDVWTENCSGCIWLPLLKVRNKMSHDHLKWFIMLIGLWTIAVISRGKWEWSAHFLVLQPQLSKETDTGRLLAPFLFHWVCLHFGSRPLQCRKLVWGSETCRVADRLYRYMLRSGLWAAYTVEPNAAFQPHSLHMRSNQTFPFQLESEIIHGTLSTRQKNVNHIVWGVLVGKVSVVSPPPNSLQQNKIPQPFWSWPKSSKLWTKIFLYKPLSRKKRSLSPISSSLSPGTGPVLSCFTKQGN